MGLIIGVDADGVLTDMSAFNLRDGKKFFKKEPVNPNAYGPAEMFDVSKDEEFKFGLKYFNKYITKEEARPDAEKVLARLKEDNHKLHEITARKFTTQSGVFGYYNRKVFENWLKNNNMKFDSIQFCSEKSTPIEKMISCSKLSVDVMIEDKPDVALHLAENGVKVLLFDAPYNQDVKSENITRVYDWNQVYEEIKKIELLKEITEYKDNNEFVKKDSEEIKKMSVDEKKDYFMKYRSHLRNLKINVTAFKKGSRRYKLLYLLGKMPVKIAFKPKIIDGDNIPYQNGFLIASNHENNYDQYLIDVALKGRPFTGFASSTIKNTFRGKLFEFINGAIFIDRKDDESKKNGSEELAVRLAHDQIGLVFPEGTRKNKDEEGKKKFLLPFKLGTVAIAQKTGVPIIPVALSYGQKMSLVRVGSPIIVKPEDDILTKNEELFNAISSLKERNLEYLSSNQKVLVKK